MGAKEKKEKEEKEKKEKEEKEKKEKEEKEKAKKATVKGRVKIEEDEYDSEDEYPTPEPMPLKDPHDKRALYRSKSKILKEIDPDFGKPKPPQTGRFTLKTPDPKELRKVNK